MKSLRLHYQYIGLVINPGVKWDPVSPLDHPMIQIKLHKAVGLLAHPFHLYLNTHNSVDQAANKALLIGGLLGMLLPEVPLTVFCTRAALLLLPP